MHDYFGVVKNMICEKTGVEPDEVTHESYFQDDLNISELELIEVLTELEEKYQIDGLVDEIDNLASIQDLCDLLIEKIE